MLYQLPDGRTIEISVYDYLDFTDEELASLVGYSNIGDLINNPLYGSAIRKNTIPDHDFSNIDEIDINDIPSELKMDDQDYTDEDE